ncbi:MAG: hypothetical protein ACI4U3_07005, partial [Traorella sp.]
VTQSEYDEIIKDKNQLNQDKQQLQLYLYISLGVSVILFIVAIACFIRSNKYKKRLLTRYKKVD